MRRCLALATLAVLLPLSAAADPRDEVLKALAHCSELPDRDARTDCYDHLAPDLRAVVGAPPAAPPAQPSTSPPPVASAPPAAPAAEQGGFLGVLDPFTDDSPSPSAAQMAYQPIGQEILPLAIGVADYDITPAGFTVTLDNGQVWQERGHSDVPPFKGDAKNYVILKHGLIGGVDLYLKGNGHLYKVRRIK